MSTASKIEWTDKTWNPVRGCSVVSAGCANCYAMKQAHRFSGKGKPYEGLTEIGPQGPRWTGNIGIVERALTEPLTWKKPSRIFVNSMSDLFHELVPDDFIAKVFLTMAVTPRHTYQVLTKRPERMRAFCSSPKIKSALASTLATMTAEIEGCELTIRHNGDGMDDGFILPNVWLGVSIEDRQSLSRLDDLRFTPASVRFISFEPMLEDLGKVDLRGIQWVILGGESGPGARPCDVAWIRSLKEQCQEAGVKVFVKQLGANPIEDRVVDGREQPRVWHQFKDKKGGDIREFPADLRVREFPNRKE